MRKASALGSKLAANLLVPLPVMQPPQFVPAGLLESHTHGWATLVDPRGRTVYDRRDGNVYDAGGKVIGRKTEWGVEWV